MTDFFKKETGWKLWRMAVWKVSTGILVSMLGTYIAATAAVRLSDLSVEEILQIVCGVVIAGLKTLDAFIDQTIQEIKSRAATIT